MLRPVLTYQALAVGASNSELGLVVASYSVLSLGAAIPVGRGIDRRGERGYIAVGTVILAATVPVSWTATAIGTVAASAAALGLGQLLVIIGAQTVIANERDDEVRVRRLASFTLVTSAAQFAAPAVAGYLVSGVPSAGGAALHVGDVYSLAFLASGVGLAVAATLIRRPGALSRRPQHFGVPVPGVVHEVLGIPGVRVALVVGFSVLSAADLLVAFMPAYGEQHGLAPRLVGLLIATHGLAAIVARLCLARLLQLFARHALLTTCLALASGALAAVPFVATAPTLFILMAISGAGIGLCQPIAIAWVASSVRPEVRGTAMSLRMVGNRMGQTIVPLGVATMAGVAGVAAAFLGPAALLLIAGGLVLRSGTDRRERGQAPPAA